MRVTKITGRLSTGIGQGRHFTRLDWARRQFIERLGIDPFPGTVNLTLDAPDALAAWAALKAEPGVRIDNPGEGPFDCDARCYPVLISGAVEGAIVLPEVDGYSPAAIEMIAAVGVREALGIADGDLLTVEVRRVPPR
jgi:CTP-dependent riboflavin kinase